MNAAVRRFADVALGTELPALHRTPTRLTLFLYGVSYWAAHRIHYDVEWARSEGYDDVLVTANLLSAYNAELVTEWAGDAGCLYGLEERNVSPALAGQALVVGGRVVELVPEGAGGLVRCALTMTRTDGTVVTEGRATLRLPA